MGNLAPLGHVLGDMGVTTVTCASLGGARVTQGNGWVGRCGDQEAKGRLGPRDSGSKPIGKLRNVESGR